MLLLTQGCALSLPLVAKLCFGSSFPRQYSEKCWSEVCVMGCQTLCRKDVGRQRRNERRGTSPLTSLTIFLESISVKLTAKYLSVSLSHLAEP